MKISWSVRLVTALIWMLAAASGVYWALHMSVPSTAAPFVQTRIPGFAADDASQQAKLARLLGASGIASVAPALPVAQRFALAGVISSVTGQGAALISVDGKPARPFLVGMQIVSGYMLKAVGLREATLADGVQSLVTITLPQPIAHSAPALDALANAAAPNQRLEPLAVPAATLPLRADVRQEAPLPSR